MTVMWCMCKKRWSPKRRTTESWSRRWSELSSGMRMNGRSMNKPSIEDIRAWGESLEGSRPQEILTAAIERYAPRLVLACSFGAEDVVLVDMIHRINPTLGLFYLDTDFLFPETYATRDRIIARYNLKPAQVRQVKSLLTPEEQADQEGPALWSSNPDRCCGLRKIEPLTRVL